MFGKILNVDGITAVVEIHKENMVVPNLMNLHVVFENPDQHFRSTEEMLHQFKFLNDYNMMLVVRIGLLLFLRIRHFLYLLLIINICYVI